jgi:hypothetical protein
MRNKFATNYAPCAGNTDPSCNPFGISKVCTGGANQLFTFSNNMLCTAGHSRCIKAKVDGTAPITCFTKKEPNQDMTKATGQKLPLSYSRRTGFRKAKASAQRCYVHKSCDYSLSEAKSRQFNSYKMTAEEYRLMEGPTCNEVGLTRIHTKEQCERASKALGLIDSTASDPRPTTTTTTIVGIGGKVGASAITWCSSSDTLTSVHHCSYAYDQRMITDFATSGTCVGSFIKLGLNGAYAVEQIIFVQREQATARTTAFILSDNAGGSVTIHGSALGDREIKYTFTDTSMIKGTIITLTAAGVPSASSCEGWGATEITFTLNPTQLGQFTTTTTTLGMTTADPFCESGFLSGGVCCAGTCGTCGGGETAAAAIVLGDMKYAPHEVPNGWVRLAKTCAESEWNSTLETHLDEVVQNCANRCDGDPACKSFEYTGAYDTTTTTTWGWDVTHVAHSKNHSMDLGSFKRKAQGGSSGSYDAFAVSTAAGTSTSRIEFTVGPKDDGYVRVGITSNPSDDHEFASGFYAGFFPK